MDLQKEVARAVIRGAGYRLMRGAPWWVAALILLIAFILGAK